MTTIAASQGSAEHWRIVVVDDHAIMRDGLAALLSSEPDLEVVGTAGDGRSAIETVQREKPHLVLMDLSMPRTDGSHAITILKNKFPELRAVVLTYHKDDAHIHAALQAGADAYVLKDDGREELLSAVRNVALGRRYISPAICDRVVSGYLRAGGPADAATARPSWDQLTSREQQVLKLIAEGYKTREIGDYLSLSTKTVEKHRSNLMRKLDLHSVSAITAYAIANGLLT